MAQEEQPGLLSKVVKFVRNPTMNWADLDQPELDKESHYSKQMLKEMIERKRRNDFVRRREFDQLRKLRQREALAGPAGDTDAAGRPSFFQSSLPSKPDDRAVTLKKIDEIEAQMSQQWWKSKDDGSSRQDTPTSLQPVDSNVPSDFGSAQHFATTINASVPAPLPSSSAYAATDVSPLEPRRGYAHEASGTEDMLAALDAARHPDWPHAVTPDESAAPVFVHDPELEEAAIRFANGDSAGAETSIVSLLGVGSASAPLEIWMTLFDLYRATGQHDKFDTVAIEFATRFGRSAPIWFSIPDAAGGKGEEPAATVRPNIYHWTSPSVLGAAQVLALQSTMLSKAPPVAHLNWSHLSTVQEGALEPLGALLTAWSRQKLRLQFAGAAHLEGLLRKGTASGDASVNPAWWKLRMELLRLMQRPDEFDLVALDYCVTYEVSPPSWQQAQCEFALADGAGGDAADDFIVAEIAPDSDFFDTDAGDGRSTIPHDDARKAVALGALSGLVLGDAADALAQFEDQVLASGLLVISCEHLVRIDFAAAGSVLNWAAAQQAAGRRVQFRNLHRVAAIFFNVIGVSEHAKVIARSN